MKRSEVRSGLCKNWLMPGLLLFSLCTVAAAYGFAASQFKLFPYALLRDASVALSALANISQRPPADGLENYRQHVLVPTVFQFRDRVEAEPLLISAGSDALQSHAAEGCLAWIMDRKGKVLHTWKNHPQLWAELKHVTRVPGISGEINPAGVHVFSNGELLATFHGYNTFPFAIGMARFDRDSNLLWKKEILAHHCFSVAEDGRIFVPALEVVETPRQIGQTAAQIDSETGKLYHDVILVLDASGQELDRISVLQALTDSGWPGHLIRGNTLRVISDDPLHLNDVQLVGAQLAGQQPQFEPDDLLISLRNINLLGVLDPESRRFKWVSSGATVGQHSPRIFLNGALTLDNLGGDLRSGGTRLVHIDFQSGLPTTIFPRADVPLPDLCRTANSGHLDVHASGATALMTLTHEGAIWEVDLETGEVVWQYIDVSPDRTGTRRKIGLAKYVYDWPFAVQ